jgi:hypothetical protein
MRRSTVARNEIEPLLDRLLDQLESEGSATQRAYFMRIRRSLASATDEVSLTTPIVALSTSPVVGFRFSSDADVLIRRIVEKAAQLGAELHPPTPRLH